MSQIHKIICPFVSTPDHAVDCLENCALYEDSPGNDPGCSILNLSRAANRDISTDFMGYLAALDKIGNILVEIARKS